ncbi:hypothetical protein [Flavobacterium hibernum]|uniref:Outer membrane protein beta-barrel domain-containing protein n=1 Tax=Flavobacterium hibernum TaxID=37752 RepID=A0A0D0F4U5_9FLAO|nr:hypothetical protein [Flavobacterium hibernum]KIO54701.1 hypothetical protein IW18_01475 [Flavobacterium hibernum]OXA85620.1 hypothetical protein B0A73_16545 [Flavobacterium hibernum]PTS92042.1 hypothetical protein DBR27_20155 [Flavobacterium sp. HMWF030]STO18455.1 Uncharacterised protein [Flavobacterium hibernum]
MKKLFCFLIVPLFFSTIQAQTTAEIPVENPLTVLQSNIDTPSQDYDVADLPWYARRFKVTAGAFFPVNNTQIQVGTNNGNHGTEIDLENDLGFSKSSSSFMGTFDWRISRRSRLGFEFFALDRSSSKTLEKQIDFGEHTYNINTRVTAMFDVQIARIAYGYAFLSKPKYEAGLLIGTHVLFADLGLRVDANQTSLEYRDSFNFTAPLPDIGVWGEFVLAKRWGLYVNANYLAIKIDNIDGRIVSYNLAVSYNVYQNLSLTAGYTGLNFKVDAVKERLNGYLKWGYNGPTITAVYTFGKHVKLYKH